MGSKTKRSATRSASGHGGDDVDLVAGGDRQVEIATVDFLTVDEELNEATNLMNSSIELVPAGELAAAVYFNTGRLLQAKEDVQNLQSKHFIAISNQ